MKDVLRCNAQLMAVDITDNQLPSRTTVERMQIELGVISDLRASEFLYDTDMVTIGFDATTQDGIHVKFFIFFNRRILLHGKNSQKRDNIKRKITKQQTT